ncbi:Ubiquitin-like protein [Trichoderma ghanense]|uniref:Ubiquitin-like protein ATG12 n=1 Tax=Trichoderma ghanense TaxID=65468 RepID=A0ABY2GQU9_9HYPO
MDPAFISPPSPSSPPPSSSAEDADANNNHHQNSSSASNRDSGAASPEIPLTLSASVMLADLPRDATAALASAGELFAAHSKVVVKFKAVGSAPALQQDVCKISAGRKFEEVVRYLRRKLRCKETDSVFLYVNSAFAPSLDEVVGNLHQAQENKEDEMRLQGAI